MPPAEILIPFFLATAAFAFMPGPGMLYAVAQTVALGRRAGWWSAIGFHLAGCCHIAAAALGVSILLTILPALFMTMKLAGAAYLIWMGVKYLRSPATCGLDDASLKHRTHGRALFDSFIVEAVNPKSALFFFLFLPQFTDPTAAFPLWLQIAALGLAANMIFTVSDGILIETSQRIVRRLGASARVISCPQKIGGCLLIGLGLQLALSRQP